MVTCKVVSQSDLHIIENYVKNVDYIDISGIEVSWLPQSKSYLKIIGIPCFPYNNLQEYFSLGDIENIIKQTQIFDNIVLALKLWVIKVSPKLDMSIIWIDIWNI